MARSMAPLWPLYGPSMAHTDAAPRCEQDVSRNRFPVHGLRMTLGLALLFWTDRKRKIDSVANIRLLKAEQYKNADTIPTKEAFDAWLAENKLVLCGHSVARSMV
jgi:hypothetical protein